MKVGNCVFVCMYVLSFYFSVPLSFGNWYLAIDPVPTAADALAATTFSAADAAALATPGGLCVRYHSPQAC